MQLYFITAVLGCIASSMGHAQTFDSQLPMLCGPVEQIFPQLKDQFHETPLWTGNNNTDRSYLAVLHNAQTRKWTVIKYNSQFVCVPGAGNDSQLILPNSVP